MPTSTSTTETKPDEAAVPSASADSFPLAAPAGAQPGAQPSMTLEQAKQIVAQSVDCAERIDVALVPSQLKRGRAGAKKAIPFPVSQQEILELGQALANEQGLDSQALFYFLYLSGARVSEALSCCSRNVKLESFEGAPALVIELVTLKNKNMPVRSTVSSMQGSEKFMAETVLSYARQYSADQRIFNFNRVNAWRKTKRMLVSVNALIPQSKEIIRLESFAINPHYLRHCRLTHLVTLYNYGLPQLMQFAGWSNPSPAMIYVSLNWRELLAPMFKNEKL